MIYTQLDKVVRLGHAGNTMKNIQNIYDNSEFFASYKALRQNNDGFNDMIEQPAIRSLLPALQGKDILDIGCGFGDFCHYASIQGAAHVLGIDVSEKMLNEAKKLTQAENITYQQVAMESFEPALDAFDVIVSSVAFHYVADFSGLIKKLVKSLKTGGVLVFSVEHPICTAHPNMLVQKDLQGETFHPVYNYRDEVGFEQTWFVEGVKKYHRKLSTYINILLDNHLSIARVLEPMPSDELIAQREKFFNHKIRPPLLVIKAIKNG